MVDVAYTPTQIQVTFAARNTGTGVVTPNFVDFAAVATDGTKLKWDACFTTLPNQLPDYSIPSFGGYLLPGENLKGTICWKDESQSGQVAKNGLQVTFTLEGQPKPAAIWDASNAGHHDVPVELAANEFATAPHLQGEAVPLKDITATFDGLTYQPGLKENNRVVMAHFSIENKGSTAYSFGNFLSYSFSLLLADGSHLGTDFMSIGCQNTSSNVKLMPGKKQSWNLCFVNPTSIQLNPGSLALFIPNPDQGSAVIWETK